jgi:hypothetical protein
VASLLMFEKILPPAACGRHGSSTGKPHETEIQVRQGALSPRGRECEGRVVAGKMVDRRILMDGLGMLTQLGVIPTEKTVTQCSVS